MWIFDFLVFKKSVYKHDKKSVYKHDKHLTLIYGSHVSIRSTQISISRIIIIPEYKTDFFSITDHIMISGAADDAHDDSNVYDTSFNVKSATPPPLAPAVEEDVTKDQKGSSKPEVKEEPEIKTRPVPKPRLSLGDAVNDEERKSALYTKPDKNRDINR